VQLGQHLGWSKLLRCERTHDTAYQRGIQRRRSRLAADVAKCECPSAVTVIEEVIDVAADGAGRQKLRCELRILWLWQNLWQQAELHLTRHRKIALKPLLFLLQSLIEAGILDSDGDLRSQRSYRRDVVFVEEAYAGMFQIHYTDDGALVDKRHHEFRSRFRIQLNIAIVFAHVGDENG